MLKLGGSFIFLLNIIAVAESKGEHIHVNGSYAKLVAINSQHHRFTRSNDSAVSLNSSLGDTAGFNAIDCFGLGLTFAQGLQWLFATRGDRASAEDVIFYFSSRKQPQRVTVLAGDQFGLEWTDFNVERRTVLIVHGFLSHARKPWIQRMEEAFLTWGDVNVVVVDWSARGNSFNYIKAVVNTKAVGNVIARLLHHIVNATITANSPHEPKWGDLHLVGHSLGAHICGFAASEFKRRQNKWKVSRITGLDPANRCFRNVHRSLRLNRDDAPFVDVIHTNGRTDDLFAFGSDQPIGHVDFYPNGGKRQPVCSLGNGIFYDYNPQTMLLQGICSHELSYVYFTDSLISAAPMENCTFWAHQWDRSYRRALQLISEVCDANKCTEMGIRAENYPHRGTYFVITSGTSPFCLTNEEIKEEVRKQLETDYADELLD